MILRVLVGLFGCFWIYVDLIKSELEKKVLLYIYTHKLMQ